MALNTFVQEDSGKSNEDLLQVSKEKRIPTNSSCSIILNGCETIKLSEEYTINIIPNIKKNNLSNTRDIIAGVYEGIYYNQK